MVKRTKEDKKGLPEAIQLGGIVDFQQLSVTSNRIKFLLLSQGISFQEFMQVLPFMIATQIHPKATKKEIKKTMDWFKENVFRFFKMRLQGEINTSELEPPKKDLGVGIA